MSKVWSHDVILNELGYNHMSKIKYWLRGSGAMSANSELKRNPQNYLRVTMLSCYIEIVLFPSSLLPIKCTKKSKLTKELSENACEEVQVMGNIIGHAGGRGFTMVSIPNTRWRNCIYKRCIISQTQLWMDLDGPPPRGRDLKKIEE